MFRKLKFLVYTLVCLGMFIFINSAKADYLSTNTINEGDPAISILGSFQGGSWSPSCYTVFGAYIGSADHPQQVNINTLEIYDASGGQLVHQYPLDSSKYRQTDFERDVSCGQVASPPYQSSSPYTYQWNNNTTFPTTGLLAGHKYNVVLSGFERSSASDIYSCDPGNCGDPSKVGQGFGDDGNYYSDDIGQITVNPLIGGCNNPDADNYGQSGSCTFKDIHLQFTVFDSCIGNLIPGVTIYVESQSRNETKSTDGNGFAEFIVRANHQVHWEASHAGFDTQDYTISNIGYSDPYTQWIILVRACGGGGTSPVVILTFDGSSNPAPVAPGYSGTLAWTVQNASSCTASNGWSGSKNSNGGSQASPAINGLTTFTISCTDGSQTVQSSVSVDISGGGGGPGTHVPNGALDIHTCEVAGWGLDLDEPHDSSWIVIEKDGVTGMRFQTTIDRGDVTAYYAAPANGGYDVSGNHGFDVILDSTWSGHVVHVYVEDQDQVRTQTDLSPTYTAPNCGSSNQKPIGRLDQANCSIIGGWAFDPDTADTGIYVHIYRDGPAGSGTPVTAIFTDVPRGDVNAANGLTGDHGYQINTPNSLLDNAQHDMYAYGIDSSGDSSQNSQLGSDPQPLVLDCPYATVDLQGKVKGAADSTYSNGPIAIAYNGSATLKWVVTGATSCTASGGWSNARATNGGPEDQNNLLNSKSYTLTCTGNNGPPASDTVAVNVNGASAPACTLTADNTNLAYSNTGTTLRWTSDGSPSVDSLDASGDWSGSKVPLNSGSEATGHLEPGTYTYQLTATGPGGTSSCASGAGVVVNVSASIPFVVQNNITGPNYCVTGPNAFLSWVYSDSSGSPQTAYQAQISTDGSFVGVIWDSGQVSNSGTSVSPGNGVLSFNTTYYFRVRVWNTYNSVSLWSNTRAYTTPLHAYPQVGMSWSPKTPQKNQSVQFTDQTIFSGAASGRSWLWVFGDGAQSVSQNPTHTYTVEQTYNLNLTATDADGYSCSTTGSGTVQGGNPAICNANCSINIIKPVPKIKEVAPK